MRFMPFVKGKKGFQMAGGGVSDSGGGGGGYVLPPATSSTLGGVKIGSGVDVTSDGTISVSGGGGGGINISTTESKIGTFMNVDLYARVFEITATSVGTTYTTLVSNVGYIKKLFNVILLANAYSDSNNYTVIRGVSDVRISDSGELQADTIDTGGANVRTVIAIYTKD